MMDLDGRWVGGLGRGGRQRLWKMAVAIVAVAVFGGGGQVVGAEEGKRPNVVVIITDDQGYGDLGVHGNPVIRTPNIDRLAHEGVQLERFHVSPVCSPTRSSLMTGRYNYRTGVVDTFIGRSLMRGDEVTLAEMFTASGYRTGIFGKWHLGDNYPLRAIDQGFQEALVLKGGGIGQASDPAVEGGSSYFDPILQHNGKAEKTRGYCSDVYTDAAINYISKDDQRPFFVYLAFNAPHDPLEVPDKDYLPYKQRDLSPVSFPHMGRPLPPNGDRDADARVYGMVSNIDDNVGRVLAKLEATGLAKDTIVVFMTDNGPARPRYNAGMRGAKATVYEGGIRVPCFVRWPGHIPAGTYVDRIAAHIDLAPTLLEACGVARPSGVAFDGKSLLPLLTQQRVDWPDRTLFFQWHRGDLPERDRAFAALTQRYKLLRPETSTGKPVDGTLELYDVEHDPYEFNNVVGQVPDVAAKLQEQYRAWFDDVTRQLHNGPARIVLGDPKENDSTLTRQDWRGPRAGWTPTSLGHWEVAVARAGRYDLTLRFDPSPVARTANVVLGEVRLRSDVPAGAQTCTFVAAELKAGPGRLNAWLEAGEEKVGATFVEVSRKSGTSP